MPHLHSTSCADGACDHSLDAPDRGAQFSLFEYIDIDNIRALNESRQGAAKDVFKAWDERKNGKVVTFFKVYAHKV